MAFSTTTNMGLLLPVVSNDFGAWGGHLNLSLQSIDSHDHTSGKGIKVPSAGLNINADLNFNNFSIDNIGELRQTNFLVAVTGNNKVYTRNGNLYYNDGLGNQIQITAGGIVNSSGAGSITGLGGDDTVIFNDIDNIISFNADGVANSMIGRFGELQVTDRYTYGIGTTINTDFISSKFRFNNGSPGNGNLLFEKWFVDSSSNIDFTFATSTFNFNTGVANGANLKATDIISLNSFIIGTATPATLSRSAANTLLIDDKLQLTDVTGPLLSQASGTRLLIENSVQLESSVDGPILSRANANRLLVANSLQIENNSDGPILSRSSANRLNIGTSLQINSGPIISNTGGVTHISGDLLVSSASVGGSLQVGTGGVNLTDQGSNRLMWRGVFELGNAGGATGPRLFRATGNVIASDNSSGVFQGNVVLTTNTIGGANGYSLIGGTGDQASSTVLTGEGFTISFSGTAGIATVNFSTPFVSPPAVTFTATNALTGAADPGIIIGISSITNSSVTFVRRTDAGTRTSGQFSFIAYGRYA
jgi:hypothetical protein